MGLIQKKDEREVIDGVEVIERSDVPEDLEGSDVELVDGESAEDIARDEEADESDDSAADHDEETVEPDEAPVEPGDGNKRSCPLDSRKNMVIVLALVAVVVSGVVGFFLGSGGFGAKGVGSATITDGQLDTVVATWKYKGATNKLTAREAIEAQYSLEAAKNAKGVGSATITDGQLDTVVATWKYKGATNKLTAREAIEAQYSLEAAKNSDGTYNAPSSEMVLAYARNQILLAEADSQGLSVTDEERDEYAQSQLGTADYEQMAAQFGVSVDQAKQIVTENATISKLYDKVVPKVDGAAPEAPAEPADGNTETASKDYADYIIKLAGDDWNAEAGAWASEDGAFAQALAGSKTFSAESATYADAQTAYYVAYQEYASKAQGGQEAWSKFTNDLYAKADMSLYGLYV